SMRVNVGGFMLLCTISQFLPSKIKKKLPISEKLFLCAGVEISFAACLAQDRILVKECFWIG
ncbi:MAG: hypothetical protein MUP24_13395, partial [Gillisia sp.]|nr:hypothetical protein [Gillisia sp.]